MPTGTKQAPGRLARAIAAVLYEEFKRQNITQTELGERVGLVQSRVSIYLRGKRTLDIDQLELFCNALNLEFLDVGRRAVARLRE